MKYTWNAVIMDLQLELTESGDVVVAKKYGKIDQDMLQYFEENKQSFVDILVSRKKKQEKRAANPESDRDWIRSAASVLTESKGEAEINVGGGGYQQNSRSNRSAAAIKDYRVPMSHITRELIDDFCANENIDDEIRDKSTEEWKTAARLSWTGEWHHTSSKYNRTNHYSLKDAAEYLSNKGDH